MIFEKLFSKNIESPSFLAVIVRSKTKLLFDGKAKSVSLKNSLGPFDILPKHENYISSTFGEITIYNSKGEKWQVNHQTGIVKVTTDKVEVVVLED